jgi:hypothetical protein
MKEVTIQFPGYMERSIGFTVPENGQFYVISFDDLIYYRLDNGTVIEIEQEWDLNEKERVIVLDGVKIPFIGLWGGSPLQKKEGTGDLTLEDSVVSLTKENGEICTWRLENFSGDWEHVTFDRYRNAFLFGAPYDFDYRYVEFS